MVFRLEFGGSFLACLGELPGELNMNAFEQHCWEYTDLICWLLFIKVILYSKSNTIMSTLYYILFKTTTVPHLNFYVLTNLYFHLNHHWAVLLTYCFPFIKKCHGSPSSLGTDWILFLHLQVTASQVSSLNLWPVISLAHVFCPNQRQQLLNERAKSEIASSVPEWKSDSK